MGTVVNFVVRNEVELRLHRIRTQDCAFGFVLGGHLGQRFLRSLLVCDDHVTIVKGTPAGLRQWPQLTVHVGAEQMENDL